mgnify:CR=1 FL=1
MRLDDMCSLEIIKSMCKSNEIGVADSMHVKIQNYDRNPSGCLLMKDPVPKNILIQGSFDSFF